MENEQNIFVFVDEKLKTSLSNDQLVRIKQMKMALHMLTKGLSDDEIIEICNIYDEYESGVHYSVGDIIKFGENGVGDPQLYRVAQAHTSQDDWKPNETTALYTAIGLDDGGYPIWARPTGAHDAYNTGDIVNYNGALKKSNIDGNVWSPDDTPQYWDDYTGE